MDSDDEELSAFEQPQGDFINDIGDEESDPFAIYAEGGEEGGEEGRGEPEGEFIEEPEEVSLNLKAQWSDKERTGFGELRTGSKRELYFVELKNVIDKYFPNLSADEISNFIEKIPRYYNLNPLALTIAFKLKTKKHASDTEFKNSLSEMAKKYSLTEADLFRYYKKISK